jgi:radical SAM-linked protein
MSLASSLAVGLTGRAEIIEVTLNEPVAPEDFVRRVNAAMSEGLRATRAREVAAEAPNPAAEVSGATYEARPSGGGGSSGSGPAGPVDEAAVRRAIDLFKEAEAVPVVRRTDKGEREMDLRPLVHDLRWEDGRLTMVLSAGQNGTARPTDVLTALGQSPDDWRIERTGLYTVAGSGPKDWIAAWDI